MNNEQMVSSVLANIRDNLLKPMVKEIEQIQKEGEVSTQQKINALEQKLNENIKLIQQALSEIKDNQINFEDTLFKASEKVKWNV